MGVPNERNSKASLFGQTEPLWTVEEVAQYLRLEPETIRAMSRDGKLPAIKVGRVWRYRRDQIKDWLRQSDETGQADQF